MPQGNPYSRGVRLDMTGDKFKELIELVSDNGKVDSLIELIRLFQGVDDSVSIADTIRRISTEAAEDASATKEDIEEIFNKMFNDTTDETHETTDGNP